MDSDIQGIQGDFCGDMGSFLNKVKMVNREIRFSGFFNDPPASILTADNWGFLVCL